MYICRNRAAPPGERKGASKVSYVQASKEHEHYLAVLERAYHNNKKEGYFRTAVETAVVSSRYYECGDAIIDRYSSLPAPPPPAPPSPFSRRRSAQAVYHRVKMTCRFVNQNYNFYLNNVVR